MFFNIMPGMKMTKICILSCKISLRNCHTRYRKKPKYGSRYLNDNSDIFSFNAWYLISWLVISCVLFKLYIFFRDDVKWDNEQEQEALKKVQQNSIVKLSSEEIEKYDSQANTFWDSFYDIHENKFFKDRHWLFTEFPELATTDNKDLRIFELGCGVGNTIFPILQYSTNTLLKVYGCDFSEKAIQILKESEAFDVKRCNAFVLDISSDKWDLPFENNSIDIIVVIFVLSAIHPDKYVK